MRTQNSVRKKTTGILFVKQRRGLAFWLIAFASVVLVIGCAFWLDPFAQSWVTRHQNHTAKIFMRNVSRFGDWPLHATLGLFLAGGAWLRGNKKWTRIFLSMLIALAIAGLAGRVIKISSGRSRPSVKSEEVWNGPRFSSKFHAFPSGHVAASTAFFAVLFLANWPRLSADSNFDRSLAHVRGRTLLIGRRLRSDLGNSLCDPCRALSLSPNRKSDIENRKLNGG